MDEGTISALGAVVQAGGVLAFAAMVLHEIRRWHDKLDRHLSRFLTHQEHVGQGLAVLLDRTDEYGKGPPADGAGRSDLAAALRSGLRGPAKEL